MNESVKQRIERINNRSDYDNLLAMFVTSNASNELKKEAIDYMNNLYPAYSGILDQKKKEVNKLVSESQTDLDDFK